MKICQWNKAVIVTACVLLALMLPLVGVQGDKTEDAPTSGEAWLTGWEYRMRHDIDPATGAGTNYQVEVKVFNGSTRSANYTSQANYLNGWANVWNGSNDNFLVVKDGTDYKLYRSTNVGHTHSLRWTPPEGGDVFRYFAFVSSGDRLFLNTEGHSSGDTNRLYYSDNGGQSFTQVTDANVTDMKFWHGTEDASANLYIGRYETGNTATVFKSTNDGVNWTDISDPTWDDSYVSGDRHTHATKVDATTGWLYVLIGDDGPVDGIWRSKLRDGSDWVKKNSTQCVGIDFLSGYTYVGNDGNSGDVFKFQDDGTGSTQDMSTALDIGASGNVFILKKDNSDRLWVGFHLIGLYTSEDGATWTQQEEAISDGNDAFMHGSRNFPSIGGKDIFISRIVNGFALRSLFDLNVTVALDDKSKADFGDVRFTDDDGSTELNYWMQEKVDSSYAIFWVKVEDDLSSTAQSIFIYYGKSDATTTSNGGNTFDIFDHFDNEVIDNPPWTSSTGASETGTTLTVGDGSDDWDNVVSSTSSIGKSLTARLNRNWASVGSASHEGLRFSATSNAIAFASQASVYRLFLLVGGATQLDVTIEKDYGEEYYNHTIHWSTDNSSWLLDGRGKGAFNDAPSVDLSIYIQSYYTDNEILTDWLFLRNYTLPEPSHSTWGAVEVDGEKRWICDTNDDWEESTCWSPNGEPQDGDSVIFNGGGTGDCTINSNTNKTDGVTMASGYTGTLYIQSYYLAINYSSTSSFTGVQGTLHMGSGRVYLTEDWDSNSVTFTLTRSLSTLVLTDDGNITTRSGNTHSLNHVTVESGGTRTGVTQVWVNGLLLVRGSLAGSYWRLTRGAGLDPIAWSGAGEASQARVEFGSQANFNVAGGTYQGFSLHMGGGYKATLTDDVVSDYTSVYSTGYYNTGITILDTNGYDMDLSGTWGWLKVGYDPNRIGILQCGDSNIYVEQLVEIDNASSYIEFETSDWNVTGDWDSLSTSPNMDTGFSNVTFGGDGTTQTITVATTSRAEFHNLTIGNGASVDLSSDLNISGSFGNGSDDGDIELGTYNFTVGTNWDTTSTDLIVTRGTSTVNLTGVGGTFKERTPHETHGLYNVTVGFNGAYTTMLSDLGIYGRFVALGGTVNPSRGYYIYLYGTDIDPPFLNYGTYSWPMGSSIFYEADGQTVHSTTYSALIVGKNNGDQYVLEGDVTTESDLTIQCHVGVSSIATLTTNGYNLTIDRDLVLGHFSLPQWNGALVAGSSTIDIGRDVKVKYPDSYITATTATFNVTRDWMSSSTSGSWDEGSSIVSFDGTDQTIDNNGQYFDKVYLNGSGDKVFIDDFGARWIMGQDGTQMHLGPDTPSQSITLTFKDTNWAGFSNDPVMGGDFNSSLYINGTVTYPHTIRASNFPATTGWRGPTNWPSIGAEQMLHNVTMYNARAWSTGHEALAQFSNVTFDALDVSCACTGPFTIWEPPSGSYFNDIYINGTWGTMTGCYIMPTEDDIFIKNFVATNISAISDVIEIDEGQDGEVVHFRNSNFDETMVDYWGGDNEEEHWISQHHNDTVGRYLIGIDWKNPVENSSISYVADGWNFGASDNVELLGGNLTIDESAIANTFTIRSNGYVEVLTGKTLSIGSNLTVDGGTLEVEGGLRTPSGTFDLYNGGGMVWLNNSTVTNANLAKYYGGFNFSLGKASNSSLNHWVLEADTGDVMALNVTHERFTVGSGSVWDMNVTASVGEVLKICTKDLTSGNVYTFSINGVFGQVYTAINGWVNISYSGWSTKWLRLEGPITEPIIIPPDENGNGARAPDCDIWCFLFWLLLMVGILSLIYIVFKKAQAYFEREVS